MKTINYARLKTLEASQRFNNGAVIVEQVEGGYKLPNGETVQSLDQLHKHYGVIIVDDVRYTMQHPEAWTDFERFCYQENKRLNGGEYPN